MNGDKPQETIALPIKLVMVALQFLAPAGVGYLAATGGTIDHCVNCDHRLADVESRIGNYIPLDTKTINELRQDVIENTRKISANDKAISVLLETVSACKVDKDRISDRVTFLERYIYHGMRKDNGSP